MNTSGRGNKIVLHVDDDEDDHELMREVLKEQDADIIIQHAENGLVALDYLNRVRKSGNLPGLIIVDINMPKMGGKEFVMELKKDPDISRIPMVIFTTSTFDADKAFAKKYGVEFFTKPTSWTQLSEILKRLLHLLSLGYALLNLCGIV